MATPPVKDVDLTTLPMRDVVNHMEHRCRELVDHLHGDLRRSLVDYSDALAGKRKGMTMTVYALCSLNERYRKAVEYSGQIQKRIEDCLSEVDKRL